MLIHICRYSRTKRFKLLFVLINNPACLVYSLNIIVITARKRKAFSSFSSYFFYSLSLSSPLIDIIHIRHLSFVFTGSSLLPSSSSSSSSVCRLTIKKQNIHSGHCPKWDKSRLRSSVLSSQSIAYNQISFLVKKSKQRKFQSYSFSKSTDIQ